MILFLRTIQILKWGVTINVAYVRDYPKYDHTNPSAYLFYDISILEMEKHIHLSAAVMPICLPSLTKRDRYNNMRGQVMGWGEVATGTNSDDLMITDVHTTREDECDSSGWTSINST